MDEEPVDFAATGRAIKVAKLVDLIDELFAAEGLEPHGDAEEIASRLRDAPDEQWLGVDLMARGEANLNVPITSGRLKGESGACKLTISLSAEELRKLDRLAQREIKASRSTAIARLIREARDAEP